MQRIITSNKLPLVERVDEFIALVDKEIGVDEAFPFGSTAKGKRQKTSDVDIIIVSRSFESIPHHERPGVLENLWNYSEELESLTYTPEEFDRAKSRLLMREILSYAKDLTPSRTKKARRKNRLRL